MDREFTCTGGIYPRNVAIIIVFIVIPLVAIETGYTKKNFEAYID